MRILAIYMLFFFLFHFHVLAQSNVQRPKLVVGIVVDQMRWDYLYRYYERYEEGGFKRLMKEGFNCQNTMINYTPSFTGPGHASIYTGTVPAIHGIVANDWVDNMTCNAVYCSEDKTVRPVDGSMKSGRMSPKNLLTTTITDELKLATNRRAKVYGVAIKDRGSILPAGHMANGAYWFDDSTGNFISSSYYANDLPGWLIKFNSKRYADSIIRKNWETLYPLNTYKQSLDDDNKYEGLFPGETAPVFPHSVGGIQNRGYLGVRYLPGGNSLIFKMAKSCIEGEALGLDDETDFLCLSFSSPDYAGHKFAPNSIEVEDMFLRFDRELNKFLNYLDSEIGKGTYTVFLTADHGGAHNPVYMQNMGVPAGNMNEADNEPRLNALLKVKFGIDTLIRSVYNYQVYFNEEKIKAAAIKREEVKSTVINWLKTQEGITYVADLENLSSIILPESIKTMIVNGYYAKRSGVIQVIYEPGWLSDDIPTGTTHGTWNPHDTHIPLLWYGWGIPKGSTYRTINMTDIAPTLAALLHIQMPNGNIGEVITEIMQDK